MLKPTLENKSFHNAKLFVFSIIYLFIYLFIYLLFVLFIRAVKASHIRKFKRKANLFYP